MSEKEKIKKIIDKTVALFGFLFLSVLFAGFLIFTEGGRMLGISIVGDGSSAILPLYGIWIFVIVVLVYTLPFIFIALIIFETLDIFFKKRFKLIAFIFAIISLLGSYFLKSSDLFFYSVLFLIFLILLLLLLFLFKELISERKRRIEISAILIPVFVLILIFLTSIFPKIGHRLATSSHEIYKQSDCNFTEEICLDSMNLNCNFIFSSCRFSPCGRPATWGCGKGTIYCKYACPKNK